MELCDILCPVKLTDVWSMCGLLVILTLDLNYVWNTKLSRKFDVSKSTRSCLGGSWRCSVKHYFSFYLSQLTRKKPKLESVNTRAANILAP